MRLWRKVQQLLHRRERVARLEEEMRQHVEMLEQENRRRGLSAAEARRQAHLAFGNLLATREEAQDALGWPALEAWAQDVRIAARSLARRPGFALSLIAVLALGIGATTAIFTLVRGVLLDPLPVPRPHELQLVRDPQAEPFLLSAPAVQRMSDDPALAGRLAAYSAVNRVALRRGLAPAEPALVQFVNGGFFTALQVPALRGRVLGPTDDRLGAPVAVAVVSASFWKKKLDGAPNVVGHAVRLNGQEVTIVGVAAPSFTGVSLGDGPDFWLPLGMHVPLQCVLSSWSISDGPIGLEQWMRLDNVAWLSAFVRAPVATSAVQGAVQSAWRPQLDAALSIITDAKTRQEFIARVPRLVPSPQGYSSVRADFRRVGLTLTLLVAAVVLATAANSATLLLLRVLARGRELGVRLALGAGRWRLARAALMEGLLLALAGTAGGVLIGWWLLPVLADWLLPNATGNLPGLDWSLLALLAGLAVVLGLAMGAAPAWLSARLSPQAVLQQRVLGAGGSLRLGRVLIVAQLALSVMLAAIAGSLALDLRRVLARSPGFERQSVVQAFFSLAAAGIPPEREAAVLEHLRATARALPDVRAVGFAASGVLSGSRSRSGVFFRGEGVNQPRDSMQHESVDAGYLDAMGLPLLRGRGFTGHDDATHPYVALISARLARETFGATDPLGRRFGFDQEAGTDDREIVGVVGDARVNGVREEPPAMFYTVLSQWRSAPACLVVRGRGDATRLREALQKKISAAEPGVMFTRWATLEERTQRWVSHDVATVRLTAGFAALAMLLAVIGVLGALGYLVASRSREIAVRLAIGAEPARVARGIVREAAWLGAAGGGAGLVLALTLPRVMGSWMMTGLETDWRALAVAVTVGVVAAVVGGLLPARRAANVDPLALLRAE